MAEEAPATDAAVVAEVVTTPRRGVALGATLAGLAAVLARLPALSQPLDRDLTAHATIGAGLANGALPYVDLIDNKQPLTYAVYAVVDLLAPQSTSGVRILAIVVAALTSAAVVVLTARWLGAARATAAGVLAALVGATQWVQGVDANTELLFTLPATIAVLLSIPTPAEHRHPGRLAAIGALLACAALLKAPAALFAVPCAVALLHDQRNRRAIGRVVVALTAGAVAVTVPIIVVYAIAGHLDDLLFWNLTYNVRYAANVEVPWWRWFTVPRQLVGLIVAAWIAVALLTAELGRRRRPPHNLTIIVWILTALLTAELGRRDFPHYFAALAPGAAVGLLAATRTRGRATTRRVGSALAAAVAVALAIGASYDLSGQIGLTGPELSTRTYRPTQTGPWIVQEEVGAFLAERADPADRLLVIGNEPGFLWASGMTPVTPHIVSFAFEVLPALEEEVAQTIAAAPPRFVVQPYGRLLWPIYAEALVDLPYVAVAQFGPVIVLELRAN